MLTWCSTTGVTGWLIMIASWGTFVALSIWAISRLIPVDHDGGATAESPGANGLTWPATPAGDGNHVRSHE